ncbi:hypothetical protein CerSpe_073750 [Prunus speciosa]
MAMLLMGLQHGGMVDYSSSSKANSPLSLILFTHKAICNELDVLHQLAMGYAMGQHAVFSEQFHFLRSIYENYLNAKDEVIFAAIDTRVKNIAPTYFLHVGEKTLFDNLSKLLSSSIQNEETFPRELAFLTGALQTLVGQGLAKEEEQVFRLLNQNFSLEEQASLVWKLLCSIPTSVVAKFLPWLSSSISPDKYQDLHKCLSKIVPEEKLLQQVIFSWMEGKDSPASMISHKKNGAYSVSEFTGEHPIDTVMLWHNAIKRELNEILEEAKKIHISEAYDLSVFGDKLHFIAEICIFHSVAESKVIYPAVYGKNLSFQEHSKEEGVFNQFRCLIESIQKAGKISCSVAELNSKICSHADQIMETLMRHFHDEEVQVLPLVRKHISVTRQRELLHQTLCVMPLKLIESALPWLVNSMTANEARNFVENMQLAATVSDIALVQLFCGWASKPFNDSCSSAIGCCSVKRFGNRDEEFSQSSGTYASALSTRDICCATYQETNAFNSHGSCCIPCPGLNIKNPGLSSFSKVKSISSLHLNSIAQSHSVWETYNSFSATGLTEQPIDVVFQVHKAIRRDLEYLDNESQRLSNCDEIFLQQFIGCFCLLWGLYKAHSDADDHIVYPALESRDALHNVSHSYTLDHKQEEQAFQNISGVLLELSHLHTSTIGFSSTQCSESSDCVQKYYELAISVHVMFKSLRMMVNQHMSREELELWPLFGKHFSVEEQNKMVGFILGTTGAEVLKSMLPWVTSALTADEQSKMMNNFKQVTKNTMFNEWLTECWKETSLSTSQTGKLETRISPKGSLQRIDHTFKSRKKNNLKNLMTSYWMAAQQSLPQALAEDRFDGDDSVGQSPEFRDPEKRVYGCKHYKRNCKLHAACCGRLFTCRYCHDMSSDHTIDWKATTDMMCMQCLNIQPVGPICSTPSCNGFPMAKSYCSTCKLFDDDRNVYHCPFCNLCRVGKGLGIDYFHCMTCNCCLGIGLVNHKCREKCLETNCPICNEFLFTSTASIRALPCGHFMHSACLEACSQSHYSCLVCSKSLGNTTMASAQSSILVGGDETMEFFNCDQRAQMKTSWTNTNPEGRFIGHAWFLVNMLYHSVLWFELHNVKHPRFLQGLKRGLENAVAGQKTKDRFLMCCLAPCVLVLFCVLSAVLILLWFKALGRNKYNIFMW